MTRFFKQIKVQMTAYYLLVSLLMILIMSGVFFFSTSQLILSDTFDQTTYAVEKSSQDLMSYISRMKTTAVYISENESVLDYLSGQTHHAGEVIDQALNTEPSILSIVIVGKEGKVLSNEKNLGMAVSDDMMKESWYISAIDNQKMPALSSARQQDFTMDKDTWVISLSQEILDPDGKNLGVLLLDLKYNVIEEYLDHLPLGEEGFAFIMDDSGQVVYHQDPSYFTDEKKKAELKNLLTLESGVVEKRLVHQVSIEGTHWTLVGVSSLDRLNVLSRQIIEVLIFVGIIALLFIIGGSYMIANRITSPIKQLQNAMAKLETFTLEKASYEVEDLSSSYHKMLDEIESLLKEIKSNEQYLREYELNALHSQINPHFLYNTLDTIVWMAEFNDSEKVIEVTKALSQFFRISLSKGQELINLESEIDHVRQYLFIQKMRYEDELNYSLELQDDLEDFKIPKIVLQPLVENAIYHGIKEKADEGHIDIKCYKTDQVYIVIKDDGVGFDSKKGNLKLGGVGLENVKKRIKLVYPDSDFIVDSKKNVGTEITIVIPYK
ncbi:sensor histidine kinase [Acidaminobacter sp. JC074]|uniref:cache domain-containing sensor histidine kinase n=1 Tax=Acidaminobacter sp. JC074 TaxID=2530199 RepID=UPI001F0DAE4E|nr:sensor histidine kinase [Acidaminobacter sp. JC074]MCH4886737.1 sensor histidine kinase [Acidaminobacter sp. JC074]